jgi:hypothetical protein
MLVSKKADTRQLFLYDFKKPREYKRYVRKEDEDEGYRFH